jgi:hypothetical protein
MEGDFVALIYAADEFITDEERTSLSDQIVASGCRYAVCAGSKSSSWEDSIDIAYEDSIDDALDENVVMTTSHDNESLEDIVFFFLLNKKFGNFAFVVLFVGEDGSYLSRIQHEIEKQLGPQRA